MLSANEIAAALSLEEEHDHKLSIIPCQDLSELRARGATSFDLRLGRWFRSFKQSQNSSTVLTGHADDSASADYPATRTKEHFVPFGGEFVLHPGRFVLGATLEWLRLPSSLSGYVTGKSTLGRHGLIIETAAGIHPQFSGCLTLELANVGEVPLTISPGMKICQIFLHRVLPSSAHDKGALSGQRKPVLLSPSADGIFDKIRNNQ